MYFNIKKIFLEFSEYLVGGGPDMAEYNQANVMWAASLSLQGRPALAAQSRAEGTVATYTTKLG